MKSAVKGLIRGERGKAMVLALILLVIGGLTATPLLAYMGSGLLAGEVYEKRTAELYAADAGVEDAVWKIQNQVDEVAGLTVCYPDWSYNMTDVNGKSVDVTITLTHEDEYGLIYLVESTATGDGSGTQIDAYITADIVTGNYSGILDNVITSICDYTLQGPTTVDPPEGEEHGPQGDYPGDWPTPEVFSAMYWEDVKDEFPYTSDSLDVKDYAAGFGPLYRDGTLAIKNTGTAGLTVQLTGTVYITGDALIGATDKDFTLDLNGQTIFVESATGAAPEDDPCNPEGGYALKIGGKCTLTGSGCIIVVGSIEFQPNMDCSPTDYIIVLSIRGKTYMQPNGDFYGTLAGSSEVYIQNGEAHWWDSPFIDEGLEFPYVAEIDRIYSIYSWEVIQ